MFGFNKHPGHDLPARMDDVAPLDDLQRVRAENAARAEEAHLHRQATLATLEAAGVPRVDSQARHDLNTGEVPVTKDDTDTAAAA